MEVGRRGGFDSLTTILTTAFDSKKTRTFYTELRDLAETPTPASRFPASYRGKVHLARLQQQLAASEGGDADGLNGRIPALSCALWRGRAAGRESIAGNPAEIVDRFLPGALLRQRGHARRAGGGSTDERLNLIRATRALAKYILAAPGGAERGVAIAYDSRKYSPEFALKAALTLAASGVKAMLFDSLRPVPVLSYTVRHLGAIAGIVITASHNPPAYNGYKVYWGTAARSRPSAPRPSRLIDQTAFDECAPMPEAEAREKGLLVTIPPAVDDDYIAMVEGLCVNPELAREMGPRIKIVYTPLHGSGNVPVRRVLRELGFSQVFVVPEQELPDPAFSTVVQPKPEEAPAFTLALTLREKLGAEPCSHRSGLRPGGHCGAGPRGGGAHPVRNQIGCLLLHYVLSQKAERGRCPRMPRRFSLRVTEMTRAIAASFG
jgi:phosphoglucomutase